MNLPTKPPKGVSRKLRLRPGLGPAKPILSVSRTVRQIYGLADQLGVTPKSLTQALGCEAQTIRNHRMGVSLPSILVMEELANLLGYEIVVQKKPDTPENQA